MSLREERRNRVLGTMVGLYDAHDPDSVFDPDGGRWVTICEVLDDECRHGGLVNHETLAIARSFLAAPWEFCEGCAEDKRAKEVS